MPRVKKEGQPSEPLLKALDKKFEMVDARITALEEALEKTLALFSKPDPAPSIQKVESFNQEVAPERDETSLKMDREMQIQSMINALKCLPPNYVKDGRHSIQNVQAICGFKVTEDMMDEAYKSVTHEAF